MRTLPMGDRACLVEDLPASPARWASALEALGLDGVVDVVPAARTVLVRCESADVLPSVVRRFGDVDAGARAVDVDRPTVTVPCRYVGPDLADVASRIGLSVDEVIALHHGATYRVAFCGFAPGFAYLEGLPPELELPRRATPRTQVPAGSVAIASSYSAVYPAASPGGWHLLGTTPMPLWDVHADPPARLTPGTIVRFEPR